MKRFVHSPQWDSFFLDVYGFERVRGEFVAQTDCLIYRLRYEQQGEKHDAALRIFPAETLEVDVDAEVAWLKTLSNAPDFQSPDLVKARDGSAVQKIQFEDNEPPRFAIVVSWLQGERIEAEISVNEIGEVGRMLAIMHTHSQKFLRTDQIKSTRSALQIYVNNFQLLNEISADAAEVLEVTASILEKEFKTVPRTDDKYGFLHGDLHGHNLLRCTSGDDSDIGVIDFSDCGWGEYGYDIATPLFYFTHYPAWEIDASERYAVLGKTYLDAYQSIRVLPADFEERLPIYFAARMFVTTQWIVKDLGDIDKEDWTRSFLESAVLKLREFLLWHSKG